MKAIIQKFEGHTYFLLLDSKNEDANGCDGCDANPSCLKFCDTNNDCIDVGGIWKKQD